ncbi:MAG: hypothetical protein HW421_1457 [Ignavibacteria bacterium]|nr:hypothetical protein [Ignavibacteria bacterium]
MLYDEYPIEKIKFNEQDNTCPFLCEQHKEENEKNAVGIRKPRGFVEYPYTNKEHAQGFSKYIPIKEAYPKHFNQ